MAQAAQRFSDGRARPRRGLEIPFAHDSFLDHPRQLTFALADSMLFQDGKNRFTLCSGRRQNAEQGLV